MSGVLFRLPVDAQAVLTARAVRAELADLLDVPTSTRASREDVADSDGPGVAPTTTYSGSLR